MFLSEQSLFVHVSGHQSEKTSLTGPGGERRDVNSIEFDSSMAFNMVTTQPYGDPRIPDEHLGGDVMRENAPRQYETRSATA